MINGQKYRDMMSLGFIQKLAGKLDLVVFQERTADLYSFGLQKCVSHSSANQESIHLRQQVSDHTDLVRYFGAA